MTINLITDPLERPLSRLPSQFKDSPVINALISIVAEELFELQQVFVDILDTLNIDSASGYWLDRLGLILNVPRDGATDEEYRVKLTLQIYYNSSSGSSEYIISALQYMTGGENIILDDTGLANLSAITDGINLDSETVADIRQLLAATVTLTLKSTLDYDPYTSVDVDASGDNDYTNPDTLAVEYKYYDNQTDNGFWFQDYNELVTADITVDSAVIGRETSVFVNRNYAAFISTTTDTTDAAVGLTAVIDAFPDISATSVANVITVTGTAFTLYQLTANTTMNPAWISDHGGIMLDIIERGFVETDTYTDIPASEGLAP